MTNLDQAEIAVANRQHSSIPTNCKHQAVAATDFVCYGKHLARHSHRTRSAEQIIASIAIHLNSLAPNGQS